MSPVDVFVDVSLHAIYALVNFPGIFQTVEPDFVHISKGC